MTHLIAHFSTQAAAMAAMQRLAGRGFPQDRLVPIADGGVRGSPDSYNVPANVVSAHSNKAARPLERGPANRRVDEVGPEVYGLVRLELDTGDGEMSDGDVRALLEETGAERIETSERPLPEEMPGVWPAPPLGDRVDVDRAIDASLRAGLERHPETPAPHEGPSKRTPHDPHR
ncbi:hypothetical protein P3W33_09025 [Luteibacter sp. PPL552]